MGLKNSWGLTKEENASYKVGKSVFNQAGRRVRFSISEIEKYFSVGKMVVAYIHGKK